MTDDKKTGSGQSQNKGKLGEKALDAGLGKPKDKSHEFSYSPEAVQVPPPKPQDTKNINKDK